MSPSQTVVLITGCSEGGIGHALCEDFAARGCVVYATARRLEAMNRLSPTIRKLTLDVTNDVNVQEVVQSVVREAGQIDILVNNAGIASRGPLLDADVSQIMDIYNTNVFGVIRMSKAVIPHMASRKSGTIVNIGSIGAEIPVAWYGAYSSSKAAVHSISDVLYMECTPLNVNVMLVSTGGVKSNFTANQASRLNTPSNSLWSDYVDAIMMKNEHVENARPMPAEDFARTVADAAMRRPPPRYITLAEFSGVVRVLKWLPRGWVLRMVWWLLGERPMLEAQKCK